MPADLWKLSDLCTPWCVHVAATLRIAHHLDAGLTRIEELAAAAGCDAASLDRVLRHLVGEGLFEQSEPGRFALNEPARGLLDPGLLLGLDLDSFGGRMANAWSSLLEAVRTGVPAYHTVFGRPFFEDMQANPDIGAAFDELMGPPGHGTPDPDVLIDGNWDSIHTVVDVGGGTGALLAEVLRAHPALRGILVDLPSTVARSAPVLQAAGVKDRVTPRAQSFFDPLPPAADLYLLKSILSDWPDREAGMILSRCAEAACTSRGRVVLVNGVSPDEAGPPSPEILMMVLVGGKGRSLTAFRDLARASGLEVHAAERRPSGRFIVECRPSAT